MNPRIGFVGVGAMGAGMVTNLRRKNFGVTFFTRDTVRGRESAARLIKEGGRHVTDYPALARDAQVVILCLPDSPSVEGVLDDAAGLVPNLAPGSIVVDCSTSRPESTRRLAARLSGKSITLLDGPLTGSKAQAEAGTVSVLGAGPRDAFEQVRPVLLGFAGKVFHLGETGAGHATKLINNYLGLLALAGLCEAWPLIDTYSIDRQVFFDAISVSGGNSATFQGIYPKFRQRDFGVNFAQKLAAKDIRYFNELAQGARLPAPVADALLAVHEKATAAGFGDQDVRGLLLYLEQCAREKK